MIVEIANFDHFKLDGGAMFGPVPRPVWSKLAIPDQENRILMASNTLIIHSADRVIIIDTGIGVNYSDLVKDRYQISLRPAPINPKSVTDIILTHLHFDHTGGLLSTQDNSHTPQFPNAKIHLQKRQLEIAIKPSRKEINAYEKRDIDYLQSANLNILNGPGDIFPNIEARISDGHTTGLQYLIIKTPTDIYAFASDLIPTSHHLNPSYHMSYDVEARKVIDEKLVLLEEAVAKNYILVFQHDPVITCARISKNTAGKFILTK